MQKFIQDPASDKSRKNGASSRELSLALDQLVDACKSENTRWFPGQRASNNLSKIKLLVNLGGLSFLERLEFCMISILGRVQFRQHWRPGECASKTLSKTQLLVNIEQVNFLERVEFGIRARLGCVQFRKHEVVPNRARVHKFIQEPASRKSRKTKFPRERERES